jgi:hypothetical protein
MTAGNQPSLTQVNQASGSLAVQLRNTFDQVAMFNEWLAAFGGASALESQLGFTSADAATIISTMGNLAALGAIYNGGTPGAAFDYMANSQSLWGGQ